MPRNDVSFDSAGLQLAGHLYTPDDKPGEPLPAIVVGHPGSGVKEQAAGLYAKRLAEKGFVALAFDAAFQGDSEGLPRGLEDPAHRVEDLKAAVTFLSRLESVDADRIGVVGICASGGYGLAATASDHRIKALVTVSAVDIARQFRYGPDGMQDPAVFQGMLDAAASARAAEARGEGVATFPLFPGTAEEARAGGQYFWEGFEYYCTPRAEHPRSTKAMPWSSVDHIAFFDAFRSVDLIQVPLLLVVGRHADTAWMSVKAFQEAQCTKSLQWVEAASHVDLYDKPQYVNPTIETLADFFRESLGSQ
jgi:fermentation-respiration switch protein FrsA (DUF1100 family)